MSIDDIDGLAKALFAESGDALFLFDPENEQIFAVNAMAERLTGLSQAQLLRKPIMHWFRFPCDEPGQPLRRASTRTGIFHSQEGYSLRTREHGWIPVNLSMSRLHVRPKTLALITVRDVREQRNAFKKVKQMEAELRRVLNSVSDCLWSAKVDKAGKWTYQYVSPVVKRITGRAAEFFLAGPPSWKALIHPEDLARWQQFVQKLRQGHSAHEEYRLLVANGGCRNVRESVLATPSTKGNGFRLDGILTDVTEHNRMRSVLAQSEKLASIGRLSAGIAHEINNPVTYISNNLVVLERDCLAVLKVIDLYQGEHQRLAETAPSAADRIKKLIDEIDLPYIRGNLEQMLRRTKDGLDRVTRIVHGLRGYARTAPAPPQQLNLPELVDSGLEIIQSQLKNRSIQVERDYADPPRVLGVFSDMNQVVLNLLVNACQAVEAMPAPHAGRICIAVRREAEEVLLEVADNGAGIAPENRARLFDPFFTTKDVNQGTGLGLWITHNIITAHGGRIEVHSEPSKGAHFRVFLPCKPEEQQ